VDGVELPKDHLVAMLDSSLDKIDPDARERSALIDRVAAGIARAFSRPGRGGRA
jgi:hypothetical protein